jgi:hypothetical protein
MSKKQRKKRNGSTQWHSSSSSALWDLAQCAESFLNAFDPSRKKNKKKRK